MPNTRKFAELRDEARRDPVRARRIDQVKSEVLREEAEYQVAELRRFLGVSQAELAEMIGKSQSAISQVESGQISLSIQLLRSIVTELGGELEIAAVFKERRLLLDV